MKFCYVVTEEDAAPMTALAQLGNGIGNYTDNVGELDKGLEDLATKGFFAERSVMEDRPDFKQVIPCFVLVDPDKEEIVVYQRKGSHTESRLAAKWTPIFGGHIDPNDKDTGIAVQTTDGFSVTGPLAAGFVREMAEETGLHLALDNKGRFLEGYIYDDRDEVGRVHLGVLFSVDISADGNTMERINSQDEIGKAITVKFEDIENFISDDEHTLEGWAEIYLKCLCKSLKECNE